MSVAARYPGDIGYAGLRMTAEEYLSLGETPERYELVDGLLVTSPSPSPRHQSVLVRLLQQTADWQACHPTAVVLLSTDLMLSSKIVYRPDMLVYAPGAIAELPERLVNPPNLIAEVLAPGSKPLDLITKRDDYDTFGVGEYWVVDPDDIKVRIWRRSGARMLEAGVAGDVIDCGALPGLRVDLAAIRRVIG